MAKIDNLCNEVLKVLGGQKNIVNCANCMTRLRVTVKDSSEIDDRKLTKIDGVMGLVHDKPDYYEIVVGPGTSKKCADYINQNYNIAANVNNSYTSKNSKLD